ncbi:unnamed protein product [Lactuca saligna]|uniref:Uncharacterized protein n=1 Tax=Lactuca saligna TaxID=75948 RepID=A0AA35VD31_LACSI|nr:unnamed protein product [Lactuca saligna]
MELFLDEILTSNLHLGFHVSKSGKNSKHFRFHESHLQSRMLEFIVTVANIVAVADLHRTTRNQYWIATKSLCTSSHPILESTILKHRFKNWQEERTYKLTARTFAQAISFWPNRRVQLWLEKIGVVEPFTGNLSTCWKNIKEILEAQGRTTKERPLSSTRTISFG